MMALDSLLSALAVSPCEKREQAEGQNLAQDWERRGKRFLVLVAAGLGMSLLAGCALMHPVASVSSPTAQTVIATATLSPSATLTPAPTFTPTHSPTATSLPTSTPTSTSTPDPEVLATFSGDGSLVHNLAFSADGAFLAAGLESGEIYLWQVATGQRRQDLAGGPAPFRQMLFSPDGSRLAIVDADWTTYLWEWESGVLLARYPAVDSLMPEIAFTPQNELAAFGIVDERTAVVWWSSGAEPLSILTMDKDMLLKSAALSPDGKTFAIGRSDGGIELHRGTDGKYLFTIPAHADWVLDMDFSADGKLLASTSLSFDPTVKIWRVGDGALMGTPEKEKWDFGSVAFSPDGSLLASFSSYGTRLWGVRDHRLRAEFPAAGIFSPDSRLFATLGAEAVTLWDTAGQVKQVRPGKGVTQIAFSPDGAALALGMDSGEVVLWKIGADPAP